MITATSKALNELWCLWYLYLWKGSTLHKLTGTVARKTYDMYQVWSKNSLGKCIFWVRVPKEPTLTNNCIALVSWSLKWSIYQCHFQKVHRHCHHHHYYFYYHEYSVWNIFPFLCCHTFIICTVWWFYSILLQEHLMVKSSPTHPLQCWNMKLGSSSSSTIQHWMMGVGKRYRFALMALIRVAHLKRWISN